MVHALLYGCEIWGFGGLGIIEKVHTDVLKHIINVKPSTRHARLYGELRRYPLTIMIKKRIIEYWYILINNHQTQSSLLYKVIVNDGSYQ